MADTVQDHNAAAIAHKKAANAHTVAAHIPNAGNSAAAEKESQNAATASSSCPVTAETQSVHAAQAVRIISDSVVDRPMKKAAHERAARAHMDTMASHKLAAKSAGPILPKAKKP